MPLHNITVAIICLLLCFDARADVHNTLLITYDSETESREEKIEKIAGVTSVTVLFDRIYKVQFSDDTNPEQIRSALRDLGNIASIVEDRLLTQALEPGQAVPAGTNFRTTPNAIRAHDAFGAAAVTPNDPAFVEQWYLLSTGQYGATIGLDLNATDAWTVTTGPTDSIVAVIGSGVDYTHEDLQGSLWVNPGEIPGNQIDDDQNGYVDDVHGVNTVQHSGNPMDFQGMGTATAGIVAAQTNNGIGVSGISWSTKILSCNYQTQFGASFVGFLSDLLECFDYVVRLKQKTDASITSVLVVGGLSGYRFGLREVAEELDSLGVLLIIAGIDGLAGSSPDVSLTYPRRYDLPNTIGVKPMSRTNTIGGPFARRTIHSIAFGDYMLTTYPGRLPEIAGAPFHTEGFEAGSLWQLDPSWSFSTSEFFEGAQSIANVAGAAPISYEYVTSPPIDLSNYDGERLGVTLTTKAPDLWTQFEDRAELVGNLRVQVSTGAGWHYLFGRAQESRDWRKAYFDFEPWIWYSLGDLTQVQFRIELSRFQPDPIEIYVDSFELGFHPKLTTGASNNYVYYSGDIPAAAIVAGAAELIKGANPGVTPSQIKNRLMSTGFAPNLFDPAGDIDVTSLNNTAVRLWDGGGNGAINCAGFGFTRRTFPTYHLNVILATGMEQRLRAMSTDCGDPGAAPVMLPDDGGAAIVLADDGNGDDRHANDGDFSGKWSKSTPGTTVLSLAGDTDLQLVTLDPYDQITAIPFEWRDMSAAPSGPVLINPPFPIKFGNHPVGFQDNIDFFDFWGNIRLGNIGFGPSNSSAKSEGEVIHWGSLPGYNGYGVPSGIDSFSLSVLAAPQMKQDLVQGGRFRIQTLGSAPTREWVIQYQDWTAHDCPASQNLKAQLIFFEDSSDFQINYAEYAPLCGDETRKPHVGIQYNELTFTKYEGPLGDNTSLVFSASGNNNNSAPVANTELIEATELHGVPIVVDLSQYFSDPDGDVLTYYLVEDRDKVSISGNILTANLDYSNAALGFLEMIVYASDGVLADKAALRMTLDGRANFPPQAIATLPVPVFYKNEFSVLPLAPLFFDPEGDSITFHAVSIPEGFSIEEEGFLGGAPSYLQNPGEIEFLFRTSDGRNSSMHRLRVDLQAERGNLPPELIAPIGTVNVEVGKMFRIDLNEHFEDPNHLPLNYSFVANPPIPLLMQFELIGGVPTQSWLNGSPHSVSVRVRDSDNAVITHDFTIAVSAASSTNATAPQSTDSGIDEIVVTENDASRSGGGSVSMLFLVGLFVLRARRVATFLSLVFFSTIVMAANSPETPAIDDILLVTFESEDPLRVERLREIDGIAEVTVFLDRIYKIEIDSDQDQVRTSLFAMEDVASVSEDKLLQWKNDRGFPALSIPETISKTTKRRAPLQFGSASAATIPNDPEFLDQWYLNSTGQYAATPGLDLNAPEAWDVTTGPDDSVVAVLGTGIDYRHEDLAGSAWVNPLEIAANGIDDDDNGYIDDVHGVNTARSNGDPFDEHGMGTAVAGLIAAQTNNGVGISGLSWKTKILACSHYRQVSGAFYGSLSDVVECFDYVIRLKKKNAANINSIVFADSGTSYQFILREIADVLNELDILLVVAGPNYLSHSRLADSTEYPIAFDLPNIIGVEPINRNSEFDSVSFIAPHGRRSIHSITFGDHLLTTYPGHIPNFDDDPIYFEGFETGTTWQPDPLWTFSTTEFFAGNQSAAMVLTNEAFDVEYLTSPPIDLAAHAGKRLGISIKVKAPNLLRTDNQNTKVKGIVKVYVHTEGDRFFKWRRLEGLQGKFGALDESQNWRNVALYIEPWMWDVIEDPTQVEFRIEFARYDEEPAEFYLDNFAVGVPPLLKQPSNNYTYYSGSLAAAALVAGAAELVRGAHPDANAADVKNVLVATGPPPNVYDPGGILDLTSLNNTAVRLWDIGGNGAVNCSGQAFTVRTWPKYHVYGIAATGQEKLLRALSADCTGPGAAPLFQPDDGGNSVILRDDGNSPDRWANDGNFAGTWSRTTPGMTTLSLAGDENIQFATLDSYQINEVQFEWNNMSGATSAIVLPDPPFSLNIGNYPGGMNNIIDWTYFAGTVRIGHVGLRDSLNNARTVAETIAWLSRGSLSDTAIPSGLDSFGISILATNPGLKNILATGGTFYVAESGTAPNRDWTIEIRDVTFEDCPAEQNLRAQLVFYENSSDIRMNFLEFAPGCGDSSRLPGVGIQYNEFAFTRYTGPIVDQTSLLFTTVPYTGNLAPVANTETIKALVKHGEPLQLDLSQFFLDPDGDSLTYHLADGPKGLSISGNILTASLDYSNTETGFVEDYVYASDGTLAGKANLRLFFDKSSNFPPRPIAPLPVFVLYRDGSPRIPLADLLYDPEGDEMIFDPYSVPFGFSLHATGQLFGPGSSPLPTGENTITFRVGDGRNTSTIPITVDIRDARGNLPPEVISPIGTVYAEVGKMFRIPLDDHFHDPNGDRLFYTYMQSSPVPMNSVTIPENLLGGVPSASWLVGSPHTISLRVRDTSVAWIQHDFTLVITDPAASAAAQADVAEPPMDEITVSAEKSTSAGGGSIGISFLFALILLTALRPLSRRASIH